MASKQPSTYDDIVKQHVALTSRFFLGKFEKEFPGPQPSLMQRRQYMYAFCNWYRCRKEFEAEKDELHATAQRTIAQRLIEKHQTKRIPTSSFEWNVDRLFWASWFGVLPEEEIPPWPFKSPKVEEGEGLSAAFASLKSEYDLNGPLIGKEEEENAAEALKRARETAALQKAKESSSPTAPAHGNIVTPMSVSGQENIPSHPRPNAELPHTPAQLPIMDREDLRKTLSFTQTKLELSYRLRAHPSLNLDIPSFETSGVDCLVNLIRHTNALFNNKSSEQREEGNALLTYAWQAFFPREVDEELTSHRIALKRGVLEHLKDRISGTLTFEDCCNSDLMNKTLRQRAIASLIEYDCRQNPNLSLQRAADQHCALQKTKDFLVLKEPDFARVLYHSHAENPKPFSDLLEFDLVVPDERAAVYNGSSCPFSLISVVRMRDTIHERDYMRIYDDGGIPVMQIESATQTPPIHSLSSKGGHSYLLVFGMGPEEGGNAKEFL
ncbi:uncharacterized protein FSUBG_5928 [Fusarium subglutinans]|uniref:Uncharacterized protein n=1 Tax=Gibberella subglutinans TaxID=42677 RepID=A0A8H5Q2T3_GIBSU|nr:uncharacterized protein FSUBG_5928 [Fusarium subglutinans]KAF5606531.1 hypothetical protein FSUBG_5928 [Fusarium subglutinans]